MPSAEFGAVFGERPSIEAGSPRVDDGACGASVAGDDCGAMLTGKSESALEVNRVAGSEAAAGVPALACAPMMTVVIAAASTATRRVRGAHSCAAPLRGRSMMEMRPSTRSNG